MTLECLPGQETPNVNICFVFLSVYHYHFIFTLCVTCVLPTCMSVHCCVPAAQEGQKRVSDFLAVQFQTNVSCQVGAGPLEEWLRVSALIIESTLQPLSLNI